MANLIPQERIESKILLIRGMKVMIDKDLAELYQVATKYLNRQVKRNIDRFPKEFMFRLSHREKDELVTNWHRFEKLKHSSSLPYAFTEHGVAMLATILNSEIAVRMSICIIKIFIKLRHLTTTHKHIKEKLNLLERKIDKHDEEIRSIFEAIKQLMTPPEKPRRIGFV